MINAAYTKLLPKDATIPPKAPQFLCQLTNISECLPIEGQDQVSAIEDFLSQFTLFTYDSSH